MTQPPRIRLTRDYHDPKTGIAYPAGTILVRTASGQYTFPGTPLGGEAIAGLFLLEGAYEAL